MPDPQGAPPVVAGTANCLIVDDEPSVRRSLVRMLQSQGFNCFEAASGLEALGVLERIGEAPLVISDMRMPELDGLGLLEAVRERYPDTSVIMLTGMGETTTAVDCLHKGAADFLLKPISVSELQARVARVLEKRALVLQNRFYQQNLERQVHEQAQRIQELFLQGVQMLARALEAKDAYTRGHSERVAALARQIALAAGVPPVEADIIAQAGLLHDLGKIGIPEQVLRKPGPLSAEEWTVMRRHPIVGAQIVAPLEFFADGAIIVRHHHERHDGSGYPDGLRGELIPLGSRIVAVADVYDALTSDRPYRPRLSRQETVRQLQTEAGRTLDAHLTALCIQVTDDAAAERAV